MSARSTVAFLAVCAVLVWPMGSSAQMSVREIPLAKPAEVTELGFGLSMAGEGDTVVVSYDGGVASYDLRTGSPQLRATTPCTGGASSCLSFGWSLAIADDRLVVGGPERDGLFLYTRGPEGGWDLVRRDGPPSGFGFFGYSVALAGSRLVVSAPYYNSSRGYASLYSWPVGALPTVSTPMREEPSPDLYGFRVDTDGELVAVACIGPSCGAASGRVYVYVIEAAGALTPLTSLAPPTVGALGQCGHGLDLAPSSLVVGCRYDSADGLYAGSVFVYPRSGRGASTTFGSPTRLSASGSTRFGESVAVSHGMVFVTDPQSLVTEPWRTRLFGYSGATLTWGPYSGSDSSVGDGRLIHGAVNGVVGRVLLVGAPGQFGMLRSGTAWLYHVGWRDGDACTTPADCLSGSCNAGTCGPAPVGATCDWTVQCAGRCELGRCTAPPPLMSVREIPLARPSSTHRFGQAAALDRDRVVVASNFLLTTYEPASSGATLRSMRACDGLTEGDCAGFGRALALSGDRLAVGIQNANGNRGELALYALDRFDVLPAPTLRVPPTRTDGAELGAAVALDGEWLAASAPFANGNAGEVATYRWPVGGVASASRTAAEPSTQFYGYLGLAIDGDLLVVGCSGERCGDASGRVFTYAIGSSGALSLRATLRPPATASMLGASTYAACGSSVALSADRLFVACSFDGRDRTDGGAVFAYPRSGTTITDAPVRIAPGDGRQGRFGESVHASHGVLFASDLEGNRTGAGVFGRVWAFTADGQVLLRGYEGTRRAAADEHRMVLAAARDTVGHALVVGAFRASGNLGEASLYHVGYEDGAACARPADCLAGGCVAGVCAPAPIGSACDWTVTCAAGLSCEAHRCVAPPGLDAGSMADAAVVDLDAGSVPEDGAVPTDAFVPPADVGPSDAGAIDVGASDAGTTDVGASVPDAGLVARVPFRCACRAGLGRRAHTDVVWLVALGAVLVLSRRPRRSRARAPRGPR